MSSSSGNASLLEYALKELNKENIELKDKIHSISKNEIETREEMLNLQSAALEAAANGIVITDSSGNILWVNNAFTILTGYTKEEVYNKNPRILKSEKQDTSFYKILWDTISNGKVWKGELVNKRKNGSFYTEELTITPLKNKSGEITNYIAIKQDISAVKAVREIEKLVLNTTNLNELFAEIHHSINDVIPAPNFYIALLDEKTDLISFPYFIDQKNLKPEPRKHKKGLTEYVIKSGKSLKLTPDILNKLVEENKVEVIGSKPASWIGIPLFIDSNSSGALVLQNYDDKSIYSNIHRNWLVSIANLISTAIERSQAQQKIKESEEKYNAIINTANDAIITIDENLKVILWNKAAEKIFGYTIKEALGKSIYQLVIPSHSLAEMNEIFRKVMGIGKDFNGKFKVTVNNKNNEQFETELSVSLTELNSKWHITGIWRDISEKKSLENKSEDEKESIIAKLKNELNYAKSNYDILNSILEVLPHNIYVKDQQSRFIKVNKRMADYLGFNTTDELLGKSDADLFDSAQNQEFLNEEIEIIKTGKPIIDKGHCETLQNGELHWAQTSKFPLFNSERKTIGTFGITTDITNIKKSEQELLDSHYRFRELINNSTLGIIRLDSYGEIIMANPAFVKMLEYNSESEILSSKSDKIYYTKANKNKFMQLLISEEKISGYEDILIRKSAELINVRESAWAIKDKNNNVIYYEVIIEDITEQNKTLNILHESEFKYKTLLNKLNEAVYLKINDNYEVVNSKFLDLFEVNDEVIYDNNFNLNNFLTAESKKIMEERNLNFQNGEEIQNVFQLNIISSSGIDKEIEVSVSHLNFNGILAEQGIIKDLTNEKKQETQIRHLQKMEAIGTLASGIAHEINTPSQFVNDNLSFLKDAYSEIEPLLKFIDNLDSKNESMQVLEGLAEKADLKYLETEIPNAINQSLEGVKRIANIVGAMRDFAHTGPKDKVSADLHRIIQNSITLSKNAWKYIAVIETDLDDTISSIICQPNDLNQVIINMIVNSSHALEDKFAGCETIEGKIKIKTVNLGNNIEIYISDNGKGMSEKVMKRIFDPFFSTKEVGKGTGQGLSIAYDIIVTKHNGKIEVTSEEGIGTTFKIILPSENIS